MLSMRFLIVAIALLLIVIAAIAYEALLPASRAIEAPTHGQVQQSDQAARSTLNNALRYTPPPRGQVVNPFPASGKPQ